MALGRWQATIVDAEGNILPGAQVTVRREIAGAPLAVLYSNRDGTAILGNPFIVVADALAAFHVVGGAYRITATSGAFSQDWRYVPIGTAAEADLLPLNMLYLFDAATADADPGAGNIRFNNVTLASVTQIYIDDIDDLGADVSAWIARFDDYGTSADRGVLIIHAADGSAELVVKVTGSLTDGGTYWKIPVTVLGSIGTFTALQRVTLDFAPKGADGASGGLTGPGATVTTGQLALFSSGTGTALAGAVVAEGSPTDPLVAGTVAGVQAAVPGHVIDAGHLRTANAPEALSDAATVLVNWTAAINFTLTIAGNRALGLPSNGIPGTWRTIRVGGNDGTSRQLTFSGYRGGTATLTDITNAKEYLLSVFCVSNSVFILKSTQALP